MDRLEVSLVARDSGTWTAVGLCVNGRHLTDVVTEFERARGWEPAGGYDWIAVDGLAPARDRLAGAKSTWPGNGRTVLLICAGCGEEGCWPMLAEVQVDIDRVVWTNFSQPHRDERDYSKLRFEFSRQQYDNELLSAFGVP